MALSSPSLSPATDSESHATLRRAARRESERASRLKRLDRLATLRRHVGSLERVALALRVVSDADAIWDEFLDADAQRVRGLLRKLAPATEQAKQLAREKAQLQLLVTEHELARRAIARDLSRLTAPSAAAQDHDAQRRCWHTLARIHFNAWTQLQSAREIARAMASLDAFISAPHKHSAGRRFLGWCDSCLRVAGTTTTHFCFEKRFEGYDLEHHVALLWRIYTDEALYASVILGGKARVEIDVLQRLSPSVLLVRFAKTFTQAPVQIHSLYLLFTVSTATSVTHYMKAVPAQELQSAMNDPGYVWASNSFWMRWEMLDPSAQQRSACDYRMYAGGTRQDEDAAALSRWKIEMLHILLRAETAALGRPLLDFSDA